MSEEIKEDVVVEEVKNTTEEVVREEVADKTEKVPEDKVVETKKDETVKVEEQKPKVRTPLFEEEQKEFNIKNILGIPDEEDPEFLKDEGLIDWTKTIYETSGNNPEITKKMIDVIRSKANPENMRELQIKNFKNVYPEELRPLHEEARKNLHSLAKDIGFEGKIKISGIEVDTAQYIDESMDTNPLFAIFATNILKSKGKGGIITSPKTGGNGANQNGADTKVKFNIGQATDERNSIYQKLLRKEIDENTYKENLKSIKNKITNEAEKESFSRTFSIK
ncbi:MAG: hypothetical protein ACRCS4_06915 [Flavobacterium sp.]